MFFISKLKSSSPTKVIQDIDGVLGAILKLCTDNMELLVDEERSSFIDEYSRLSDARLAALSLTKNRKSALSEILGECEALEQKIKTTCSKRQLDNIKKGRRISLPTSTATIQIEGWRQSVNSSLNTTSPPVSSVAANGDATTTQVRRQIESGLSGLTPLSHSGATNSESWHTAPDISAPSNTTTEDRPSPSVSTDIDCMIIEPNSHVESATFNIDSEGATGATPVYPAGSRVLPPAQQQSAARVYQPQVPRTVKRERVMCFGSGSTSYNATLNIRSANASGAMEQIIL